MHATIDAMAPPTEAEAALELDRFYRDHHRAVLALAYSLVRDWRTAEDITHDAFVDVCRHRHRLANHPRPDLWVRRAAISRATSALRRRQAERRAHRRAGPPDAAAPQPDGDAAWLLDLIGTLPRRQAAAFVLVHLGHLTIDEAADSMGCSPSTLRTHLERARTTLRAAVTRSERVDPEPVDRPNPLPDPDPNPRT